ncbi:MAG: hypothetical protein JNM56_17240 [Planctomycetia bacterium]|nr:hypothetical protein [Planctomycetia bacterium]
MNEALIVEPITPELVRELREAALQGATVRGLTGIVRQHLGCRETPTIPLLGAFVHAFRLPLIKVLPIREWLGTDRDEEIDALILPEIDKAKDKWLQPV